MATQPSGLAGYFSFHGFARCARDAGISPWWAALMLIPLVSLIMMIVLGSMRSVDQ